MVKRIMLFLFTAFILYNIKAQDIDGCRKLEVNNIEDIQDSTIINLFEQSLQFKNSWDSVFNIDDENELIYYYNRGCTGHNTEQLWIIRYNEKNVEYVRKPGLLVSDPHPILGVLDKKDSKEFLKKVSHLDSGFFKQSSNLKSRCLKQVMIHKKNSVIKLGIFNFNETKFKDSDPSYPSLATRQIYNYLIGFFPD